MSAVWVIDGKALKWWGREWGWFTAGAIAEGLGVAPSTLSRIINGKAAPGESFLAAVRLTFGDEGFADICQVVVDDPAAALARGES